MIQRQREVVLKMLPNVKQTTIAPLIKGTIVAATLIYTDFCSIYSRLSKGGYDHKSVCDGKGEYARGRWRWILRSPCEYDGRLLSVLWSWFRLHRGIFQEKFPLYLGFFEFVHNTRKRGKSLLLSLLKCLLK